MTFGSGAVSKGGSFYCIWIKSTIKKGVFGTLTLTEVLILAELWSQLRAEAQQRMAEKCIAPTLPLLMLQMDGVLGRKGDDFWQQGTEMTALHLWRAAQGLGSKHLLGAPDRALMPSWTISFDDMSSCHTRAHGQAEREQ